MMNLHEVILSKTELDRMPIEERQFLFLAGYICNELSVLKNLMSWSLAPSPSEATQEYEARTSQALFLLRLFVGKLYEAKSTLYNSVMKSSLRNRFEKGLAESLISLDKFMVMMNSDPNVFRLIRNKLSFHNDKLIAETVSKIPDDADLRIYWSESQRFGSYYGFSDIGVLILLAEQAGQPGLPAINRIVEESLKAANLLMHFLEGALRLLLQDGKVVDSIKRVEISGIEAFQDVSIPYFTTPGGSQTQPMPMTVRFPPSISGVQTN